MEGQLNRPHAHNGFEDHAGLPSVIEGEGEQGENHQHKSVMSKVKGKAKKIKDTIKKHGGQGHEHEHETGHEDGNRRGDIHQEGYEDAKDEEMVNDPEVQGAPMYETSAIKSTILPREKISNVDKQKDTDHTHGGKLSDERAARPDAPGPLATEFAKLQALGAHEPENKNAPNAEEPKIRTGPSVGSDVDPRPQALTHAPENKNAPNAEEHKTRIGPSVGSDVDPRPQALVAHVPENKNAPSVEEPKIHIGPSVGSDVDRHSPSNSPAGVPPSNYQSKVADPTRDGGKESGVAPLVKEFSSLNVHNELDRKPESEQRLSSHTGSHDRSARSQETATENKINPAYNPADAPEDSDPITKTQDPATPNTMTGKISSAATAAGTTAVSAKNVIASKLGYGGEPHEPESEERLSSHTGSHGHIARSQETTTEKPVSNAVDTPEGTNSIPKTQDPATPNTMYGKASSAATAAATTAVSAKNAVASKLGYGGDPHGGQGSPTKQSALSDDKVAGAGGPVKSSIHGSGDTDAAPKGGSAGGGAGVKGYLAGKFKPGDDDKALSQSITDAFANRNEGTGEGVRPGGKVRQSKEVTERLGPEAEKKREGEDALAAGEESSGQGVVERVKDAVSGWLGKGTGMQTAQDSVGQSYVSDATSASTGAGRGGEVEQRRP